MVYACLVSLYLTVSVCVFVCVQLLIGFESGCVVLWDLKNKNAEFRYTCVEVRLRHSPSLCHPARLSLCYSVS